MAFATVFSVTPALTQGRLIAIEADLTRGLHAFSIVGLPDKAVEESKDRVSAAIKNCDLTSPKQRNHKITIALAPASIKKEGPSFDLPIALAYLLATEDIRFDPTGKIFVGELALSGEVRGVRGVLTMASTAKALGYQEIYVPEENAKEAALVSGIRVYPVNHLRTLMAHLTRTTNEGEIPPMPHEMPDSVLTLSTRSAWDDIRGQEGAKRGLLIAAAGGHNLAMWGPPGTGKTMLARAFTDLLPPLSEQDALEATAIHSVSGVLKETMLTRPPLRAPHHTASYVSVIGGGAIPKPGEVTLAHRGVLFLDEFPEFDKRVLESLRQPIEEGMVHVARAKGTERFPASFTLIAAMNPCPCGYWGDEQKPCVCGGATVEKYQRKISGPIVDRIDIWIEVKRMPHEALAPGAKKKTDTLSQFQADVLRAAEHQRTRFRGTSITSNAKMTVEALDRFVRLSAPVELLLRESAKKLDLSPRAYHRMIKLARTIADLEESRHITESHMLEALHYRPKRLFAS